MITDEMVGAACAAHVEVDTDGACKWPDDYGGKTMMFYREAMRAALEAAERAAWRPISEAPRDGTEVILCDARTNTQVVAQWTKEPEPDDSPTFGWETMDGISYLTLTFTHFRFRPIPPEAE